MMSFQLWTAFCFGIGAVVLLGFLFCMVWQAGRRPPRARKRLQDSSR